MLKSSMRKAAYPLRRYFNPRFESIHSEAVRAAKNAEQVKSIVDEMDAAAAEATAVMGRALDQTHIRLAALEELIRSRLSPATADSLDDLSPEVAAMFARETSHLGLAAQEGVWFNPPVSISYQPGSVRLGGVNERIAEVPFVFGAVSDLPLGARILDVGSAESTVAVSLASLGYKVTAVDPRGYPLQHPNLTMKEQGVEHAVAGSTFDAVVCLSTIEHLGVGAYGQDYSEDGDLVAMAAITKAVVPGGLLVFTAPFGDAALDDLERVYDEERLGKLLEGWDVIGRSYLRRVNEQTWVRDLDGVGGPRGVVLLTAHRSVQ